MNISDFKKLLKLMERDLNRTICDTLPRKAGIIAVNHTRQNFREGGFRDGGLHKWKLTRRQQSSDKHAGARYDPLQSGRNRLMGATDYRAKYGKVTVYNPVEYAGMHNDGGEINTHPRVTPKLRKMAWARYFKAAGITRNMKGKTRRQRDASAPPEARMWKAIALTRKDRLDVHATIPQRKFLGESKELGEKLRKEAEKELLKTVNKYLNP